jgi:hypothetical protein
VPEAGGRFALSIVAPSDCGWTARSDTPWAEVGPVTGQGNGNVELRITRNEVRDARTAVITVNSQSVRVVQSAAQCVFTLTPSFLDVTSDTGPVTIALAASMADCPWTATASESWLRPRSSSGAGNASIVIDIDSHVGAARRAFLTIAGLRLEVSQQGR